VVMKQPRGPGSVHRGLFIFGEWIIATGFKESKASIANQFAPTMTEYFFLGFGGGDDY
jgi:hypothetical protein